MPVEIASSQVAILSRILRPERGTLSAAVARDWLVLDFSDDDRRQMRTLVQKNRDGKLTPREANALDNCRRVGRVLDLMHSKARRSRQKRSSAG